MPELPEIANLSRQFNEHLAGKTISAIEVLQPKCLNIPVEDFTAALTGATVLRAFQRGKWIVCETDRGYLLVNLGMGGETLLVTRATLPAKYRLVFDFSDGSCLAVNFWWFGYSHFAPPGGLETHEMLRKIGLNALDVPPEQLAAMLAGKKQRIKEWLLDQSNLAGIGNAYVHDILWLARLHPLRKINTLTDEDMTRLYQGIHAGLQPSLERGGAFYEMDLFGKKGGFLMEDIHIGYREGQPCPNCGTPIVKLKTGSTTGFICPSCQPA